LQRLHLGELATSPKIHVPSNLPSARFVLSDPCPGDSHCRDSISYKACVKSALFLVASDVHRALSDVSIMMHY
jgi:hypothetical protein